LTDNKENNEIEDLEALFEKIEECPSKKVREAMREALNKENTTIDNDA
jgi:hypothetical protein